MMTGATGERTASDAGQIARQRRAAAALGKILASIHRVNGGSFGRVDAKGAL